MGRRTAELGRLLDVLDRGPGERLSVNVENGLFTSTITTVSDAPTVAAGHAEHDCWYGTAALHPRVTSGRGCAVDVVGIREPFADLDIKVGGLASYGDAATVIDVLAGMLGTAPVAVVHSGHGLQPHWAIERSDGTDWADEHAPGHTDATALFRRWGRLVAHVGEMHGGHVDPVYDLSRVLRVPGTVNHKFPETPVSVTVDFPGGSPVSLEQLREVLDEHGAHEVAEDRDVLGEIVAPVADWAWAEDTHPGVRRAVESWSKATPDARHPWLLGVATSLAFAHRLGMVTEAGLREARMKVTSRFRWLLAHQTPMRAEGPAEVAHCWAHGANVAQRKSAAHAISAYRSLADSRGADIRTVLNAAANGDLRSIVEMPDLSKRSKPRRMSVREARARLLALDSLRPMRKGAECRKPSVWVVRIHALAMDVT